MSQVSAAKTNSKRENTQIGRALNFFSMVDADTKKYSCNICQRNINGKQKSNLITHMKIDCPKHQAVYFEKIVCDGVPHILVQRESFILSAVELVTINSEPFSILSKSGYRNGHKIQLEKFKSADCPVNLSDEHVYEIKDKVRSVAKEIKELIKTETHKKIVSIMVDSATRNGRSVFGISLQYKLNGVVKVVAIGMYELKKSHTAVYLAEVLLKVLGEYEITLEQVISITTDNGSNMLAMVKEVEDILFKMRDGSSTTLECEEQLNTLSNPNQSDENTDGEIDILLRKSIDDDILDELLDDVDFYEGLFEKLVSELRNQTADHSLFVTSIKCAAHTIQLAVKDALKLLSTGNNNVIELCRLVAKFFRKQSTKNEMHEIGLTSTIPDLDCKTRWSSTYLMVMII